MDGTVNITCLLFNDQEEATRSEYRYKVVLPPEPAESSESEVANEIKETKETEE